jgi:geranylgeranyl pyrophosphate synthase
LNKAALLAMAQRLLQELGLDSIGYLGFTMVALNNAFWMDQVRAVAFQRRVLLLPHCLRHSETCPAEYDEKGLRCQECGSCGIAAFKTTAEELGYKVLVAEGSPIVTRVIAQGEADALVGVACLDMLEKALDKLLAAGIPAVAVPLLSNHCKDSSVDEDWVHDIIAMRSGPASVRTRTYIPLLRKAHAIFEEANLERLVPRRRKTGLPAPTDGSARAPGSTVSEHDAGPDLAQDPTSSAETIAYKFLGRSGKRFRPFVTLAAYDAVTGGQGTNPEAVERGLELPDSVVRIALAIEIFHKASLIHDDIEDDDDYRYGLQSLHRQYGMPAALNVGDYLIGLGYRAVADSASEAGPESVADILQRLAQTHVRLCEGQGAELAWRNAEDKSFTPLEALKIYALKTAPAFEAALFAGFRLAGPAQRWEETLAEFSRNLGVAYQILNDLEDWNDDDDNKLRSGNDILAARPTLLLALALEAASDQDRQALLELLHSRHDLAARIPPVRLIYDRYDVFGKAERLVDKYRSRTEAVGARTDSGHVRELFRFLAETILQRETPDNRDILQTVRS